MQETSRNRRRSKGIAMVELLITLALLLIVSTMIVSFSAVAKDYVDTQRSQYAFLEETSQIKQELSTWLSQMDEESTVCTVAEDALSVTEAVSAAFKGKAFMLICADGAIRCVETERVTGVAFTVVPVFGEMSVVKCSVTGSYNNKLYEQSFLLTLRCGSFAE